MNGKAVIIMGSERDLDFCREIAKHLRVFGIDYVFRVGSAHKTPQKVLKILEEFDGEKVVYITVAGRSNALSAFIDASTAKPVIACPPYSDKYGGVDIYSSLRVPSGIGCMITIEAEAAAIATAKIFAAEEKALEKKIKEYQLAKREEIEKADETIKKMK